MPDIKTPEWKNKNRASQIMSRLERHANGEIEMTKTQITAAQIFLKKVIPDLSTTTLQGDSEKPVVAELRRTVVDGTKPNA